MWEVISTEEWKPIKGYEGLYEVSNYGRIKGLNKTVNKGKCHRNWEERYLKFSTDNNGYYRTNLAKNGINKTVKVHRIVAQTFIDNPLNKKEVNHKDGNKQRDPNFGAVALSKRFRVHRKTISRIALFQYWKEGDLNHVKSKII